MYVREYSQINNARWAVDFFEQNRYDCMMNYFERSNIVRSSPTERANNKRKRSETEYYLDTIDEARRKRAKRRGVSPDEFEGTDGGFTETNDLESLLHDFLDELLYRFEMLGQRLAGFFFGRLDANVLEADAAVNRVDARASVLDREVKAVTYHDLNIVKDEGRYEVTVVLDI